ncbi:MAG: hypothetical protein IJA87_01410 [Clostridia bacterium]|nr:hypothetical protein [Clostridia bacterium]
MDSEKTNKQLIHTDELKNVLEEICQHEQVYSVALFDILGFSKLVSSKGNQVVLDLYNKLLDTLDKQRTHNDGTTGFASSVVPVPVTKDWKQNIMMAEANGFINACHFSDTFLIYVNYELSHDGFALATPFNEPYPLLLGEVGTAYYPVLYQKHNIYLSFLQTCMEFFCQAIVSGIPLRGCISTGLAIMDHTKSIYIVKPIVEAARGEPAQNSLGIAFGNSFNNSHPVYNKYFIPYLNHLKPNDDRTKFLSPMMLDWARYWRDTPDFKKYDFIECINNMNTDEKSSSYYENAINFFEFSKKHEKWYSELNREEINDITDYYKKATEWFESVK